MSGRLGLVELLGVDEGEDGVGRVVQLVTAVVTEVRMLVRRGGGGSRIGGRELLAVAASSLARQQRLYFLPLPQGQRSFRPILAISPTSVQRTDPLYQAVLADAKFHEQLLVFDHDLSATARAAGCHLCGGALHSAQFARKPRGCPPGWATRMASASASAVRRMAVASG